MAHEISITNGVASYADSRVRDDGRVDAWHRLGTPVGHAMTAEEALEAAHLVNWNVRKRPIWADLREDGLEDEDRAVHDYFGHAATGRSFDRHGEQAAFNAHSKMFSPQALPALASETRGQNSSLILNGQFPPRKIATLPEYQQQKVARRPQSDDEFDRSLMKSLHDDGGTTFRENIGDGPTSGYMMSQTPDNRLPAEIFRPEQVREVRDQNRPRLKQHPDEYNGIWSQPDGVYHEISKNHPGYYDAIKDAYDRDQIALYDLGYGTDIDTAATQYNGQPGIYMARSWFV